LKDSYRPFFPFFPLLFLLAVVFPASEILSLGSTTVDCAGLDAKGGIITRSLCDFVLEVPAALLVATLLRLRPLPFGGGVVKVLASLPKPEEVLLFSSSDSEIGVLSKSLGSGITGRVELWSRSTGANVLNCPGMVFDPMDGGMNGVVVENEPEPEGAPKAGPPVGMKPNGS
jgi:hypothetical protein